MVLLSAEKRLKAEEIAEIVRTSHITVLRWLKRYMAEGIEGLKDEPREGSPAKVTESVEGHEVSVYPTPCGRCGVWQITWLKKQGCGSPMKPSAVSCEKLISFSVVHSTP